MRVRLALTPMAVAFALLGACATKGVTTPSTPAATTPAGNGVADLSATAILDKAIQTLKQQTNYRMKGIVTVNGQVNNVDLSFSGTDFTGSIDIKGTPVELTRIGADVFVTADALWSTMVDDPGVLAQLKGKIVKLDAANAQSFTLSELSNADKMLSLGGRLSKGEQKAINGTPAIALVSTNKAVLYVATTDKTLPLHLDDAKGNVLDFEYASVAAITPPPATADVLDMAKINAAKHS
jgi:hypothetical protein